MKILKLVDSVPGGVISHTKYLSVYIEIEGLKDGQVMPIQFNNKAEAISFCQVLAHRRNRRNFPFRANQRGDIVYVSRIKEA